MTETTATTIPAAPSLTALLAERATSLGQLHALGYAIRGVLHVGANNGYEIPHYFDLGAERVVAVEPLELAVKELRARFHDDPRVEILACGLSDMNATGRLRVAPGDGMGSGFLRAVDGSDDGWLEQPTRVRRGDSLKLDWAALNALVIDTQGTEMDVLQGMGDRLRGFDVLVVECSKDPLWAGEVSALEVGGFLADEGFVYHGRADYAAPASEFHHGDLLFYREDARRAWEWPEVTVREYVPGRLHEGYGLPLPRVPTSWQGIERVLPDVIERFQVDTQCAVEFGVWHTYSTAALANNFDRVYGVEPFVGDRLAGTETVPMIETSRRTLLPWGGKVTLIESGYREFLGQEVPVPKPVVGLVHIDVVHSFEMTLDCGYLTHKVLNPKVIAFHDTRSPSGDGTVFEPVTAAVKRLAQLTGRTFWECTGVNPHGLGILVRE